MEDPDPFEPDEPWAIAPPSRLRRVVTTVIVVMLVASMIFLAWVSGRGPIHVEPDPTQRPGPTISVPVA